MAVANTVSAVAGGAVYPTLAVNSLGDGSGNAALEEVVMALEKIYGFDTGMDTTKLYEISKLVEERSGCYLSPQKPISGLNSYRHESEVHVSGVLKYPEVYEPIKPEEVGRQREFVIGKHSGPSIIRLKLGEKGMNASDEQIARILEKIKAEKEGMDKEPIRKMLEELDRYGREVLGFPEERFWEIVREVLDD
jgi:isopropylmalate/homocitrate/citramalate synthase